MKKFFKLLCIALSVLTIAFCATACGDKVEYTYWQTEAKQAGDSRLVYVAELSFGSTNVDIAEVWVNVSNFKAKSSIITLKLAKTTTSVTTVECPITSETVKEAKDGWVQLVVDKNVTCKSVTIEVVDVMQINEIVFIKSDAKLAKLTFTKGGVKVGTSSANLYTESELKALAETNLAYSENPAFNVIDEQDKFPVEKIQTKK